MRRQQNHYQYWIKVQRRYRKTQARWVQKKDAKLSRKLDILGRRLQALNRKWKLGIAASVLSSWMAMLPPATIQAQNNAPFPRRLQLSSLNGDNGFTLNGTNPSDGVGRWVSAAGDINGDGIDDFVIGTDFAGPNGYRSGASYVIFGNREGFDTTIELSSLNGVNGFVLAGEAEGDGAGNPVSHAGDINGDGIDDLIIGASLATPNGNNSGSCYVVFGNTEGFSPTVLLSSLDGSNGFTLDGLSEGDGFGASVDHAGDVNSDGIDDIIIGAYGRSPNGKNTAGSAYVIFGSESGFGATIDLSALNGSNGFVINGVADFDRAGGSVSGLGDVNGDGIDDVALGARLSDAGGITDAGSSYVVFGSDQGFTSSLELSSLDGSNGFVIHGVAEEDQSGQFLRGLGDVNGDGVNDMIISATQADNSGFNSGSTYIVLGSNEAFPAIVELSSLDGDNGFVVNGERARDGLGRSVHRAGDLNGDGLDDIVIGASARNAFGGSCYVIFGSNEAFDPVFDLASLNGGNGLFINGISSGDRLGTSASHAGDVNGDGVDDLVIGAPGADTNASYSGSGYVIFGVAVPVVANALEDQTAVVDETYTFEVPSNTFTDKNIDDTLVLSATFRGDGDTGDWLSFDPSTNTLSGTPSSYDLGTSIVKITATDPGGLSVSDEFDLQTLARPALDPIGPQSGDLGSEITFTASASDPDSNTLTFSLDAASLEKGMEIGASNGEFRWMPSESQGGEHEVTITVSDEVLSDAETLTITVNTPPVLQTIEDQTTIVGSEIRFTASATDPDSNPLTFSLDATSLEKGMTIDENSGQFTWTPGETQAGTHEVTITVSDGSLTDSEVVSITVNRVITSITDEVDSQVQLHPNPVEDRFQLIITNGYVGNIHLRITDLEGQVFFRQNFNKEKGTLEMEMNIGALGAGIYLVEVQDDNETILARERVMKR